MKNSAADILSRIERRKLRPKTTDFKGRKGFTFRQVRRPDGTLEDRVSYKPNENGRPTKQAQEVLEAMLPSMRAETEWQASLPKTPKAVLKDATGAVQYVEPELADTTARRNGWRHHWRAGGAKIERGLVGGMLFRRMPYGWEPTGVTCLGDGRPEADKSIVHWSPDETPWHWVNGEWQPI